MYVGTVEYGAVLGEEKNSQLLLVNQRLRNLIHGCKKEFTYNIFLRFTFSFLLPYPLLFTKF